jgi:hypothetical protein
VTNKGEFTKQAININNSARSELHCENYNIRQPQLELCVFYQNLCGISNKKDDLEVYLSELPKTTQYVCITEHFLNAISAPIFSLNEYAMASYNVRSKKNGEAHSF